MALFTCINDSYRHWLVFKKAGWMKPG